MKHDPCNIAIIFSLCFLALTIGIKGAIQQPLQVSLLFSNKNPQIGETVTLTAVTFPSTANVKVSVLHNGAVWQSATTDSQGEATFQLEILSAENSGNYTAKLG